MNTTKGFGKVTKNELPTCWINKGSNYYYTAKGGIRVTTRQLPFVSSKYEKLLELMNIPYKRKYRFNEGNSPKRYQICEFWDPDFFETEEMRLPLYIKASANVEGEDMYIYADQSVTFGLPTTKTVGKAHAVAKKIFQQIKKYEETIEQENCWEYAKEILGDSAAAVCMLKVDQKQMELKDENNHIKMLQVYSSKDEPTGCYGIFNMEKLKYKDCIVISVPEKIVGFIVGKGGKNKKNWEKTLGNEKTIVIDGI